MSDLGGRCGRWRRCPFLGRTIRRHRSRCIVRGRTRCSLLTSHDSPGPARLSAARRGARGGSGPPPRAGPAAVAPDRPGRNLMTDVGQASCTDRQLHSDRVRPDAASGPARSPAGLDSRWSGQRVTCSNDSAVQFSRVFNYLVRGSGPGQRGRAVAQLLRPPRPACTALPVTDTVLLCVPPVTAALNPSSIPSLSRGRSHAAPASSWCIV